MSILCQLGEAIPNDVTEYAYADELGEVKLLLNGKSRQGLLSLPKMSKMNKLVSVFDNCGDINCARYLSYFSYGFVLSSLGGNAIYESRPFDDL